MEASVKIFAVVIVLVMACCQQGFVATQSLSKPAVYCYNTTACPCCSVPCPSDGSGHCSGKCKDGYYGGKCYNLCPDNCIRCVDAQQGGVSNCTLCKDGYHSTATMHQCQSRCSNSCQTCDYNASHCTSCLDGYYLTENNTCAKCIDTCKACKFSSSVCTSCHLTYYLNETDGSCHKCNPLCYDCDSPQTCFCSNGCFYDSISVSNCHIDTNMCGYGCKRNFTSSVGARCDKCIDGYFGLECDLKCDDKCSSSGCYRTDGICYACKERLFGNKCTNACPDNCENTCNRTTGQCVACKNGFHGPNCSLECVSNCSRCQQQDGLCSSCKGGYFGINCTERCPTNCRDGTCNMINGDCITIAATTEPLTSPTVPVVIVEPKNYLPPVAGGTVSAVLVIAMVAVLAVIFIRRRSASSFKGTFNVINLDEYNLARIDMLEENDEFDPKYFTGKVVTKKKPCGKLPVKDLTQFVDTHGEDFYQEEFLKLPRGLIKPCEDAKMEKNIIKNRYTGIYPYDDHRVKLLPPGSDFINACYIDGFKGKKEYISSLGPTRKAMEGFHLFWRMVWQEKTDVIVMVTNLMEGQAMKCEKYWPNTGSSLRYGDIIVTSHSKDVYSEFVVRKMTLSMGCEKRSLNHLHYTAWPDKQVPDDVTSLIEFRQKVKTTESILGGPIIVHCSAGIGRTGTYIAMDILIHQGKAQKSLDVFEWVTSMRQQRTSMVQTWIMSKPEKPGDGVEEARTINRGYDGLNREGADIPGSLNRPLLYLDKKFGECNYINAVYINSFTIKNRFLVCQTPLPDTVKDFLTLIIQESCSCIVSMDPPGLKDQTIGEYFSRTHNETFILPSCLYEVGTLELDKNPSYILRKLTIQHNQRSGSVTKTVYHYQCHHWPYGNRVPDVSYFLQLVRDVDAMAERNSDHGPVLVHCLNAAERSGLYCAVSNMVQKMGVEGEVSVVNTLRQVKVRRPLAIPNKEQILFCYRAIQQFLNLRKNDESVTETAIYCNV